MIRVCTYAPAENDGEPKIFAQVTGKRRWRIEMYVAPVGSEPSALTIRVEDKLPLADVHRIALDAFDEMVPEGTECTDARFDLWADV